MALAEEVIFKATLDANNFDRAAANMRRSAESAGAAATTAGQRFSAASGQTQSMSKSTLTLSQRLKNFEPVLGKTATGVSGMAGAMQNTVGQTNAMTGAVAGMAGAFAGGGALAVGIGGITLLVGYLAEAWMSAGEEAKKAEQKQIEAAQGIAEQIESKVKSARIELAKIAFGAEEYELKMAELRRDISATEKEMQSARAELDQGGLLSKYRDPSEQAMLKQRANDAEERWMSLSIQLANAEEAYAQLQKVQGALARAKKRKNDETSREIKLSRAATIATKEETKALKEERNYLAEVEAQMILDELQEREDALNPSSPKGAEKGLVKAEELGQKYRDREIEAEKKKNKELLAAQEKANQEKLAVLRVYSGEATGIINGAFATSLDALERVVAGEKVALHEMLILWATSTMKQAGIRIFASGLATFIDGLLMSSVVPGSGSQAVSSGAAAMSIGAALGAGGAVGGGVASRMGIGGAGGTGAAGQTPGVNSGSLGSAGSRGEAGGGETRNTYVFNAPVYGSETESAQEQSRLQKIARDDLLERA